MTFKTISIIVAYEALFLAVAIAVAAFRKRFREQRPPLEFEYARLPGESLSKRIEKANEGLINRFLICMLFPPAVGIIVFLAIYTINPETPNAVWITACCLSLLGGLALATWAFVDGIRDVAKLELGLKGERIVADFLKPLEREGWRVFHDVPAHENGKDFNLDHVAIGPTGVALIETKARSKGKALPGREAHVVTFDGKRLEWPWSSSTSELEQLKRQREWLEGWMKERTGLDVPVLPILAIPGWWTECKNPRARTRIANHKTVCAAVKGRGETTMDPKTIDLLARQMESICRIRE